MATVAKSAMKPRTINKAAPRPPTMSLAPQRTRQRLLRPGVLEIMISAPAVIATTAVRASMVGGSNDMFLDHHPTDGFFAGHERTIAGFYGQLVKPRAKPRAVFKNVFEESETFRFRR